MNLVDEIFIIEKPLPFIPAENTVARQALQNALDKGKKLLPGFLTPLYAQGSLNINIKKYFTDANGTLIAKSAAPAALQKDYPVYLLGNFDRIGAFNVGQKTVPQPQNIPFLMTYVNGYSNPFLFNTGFNDVVSRFKVGDIITVFTDNFNAPTAYVFIVQTCDYGSLASIISNTQTQQQDGVIGQLYVKNIAYQCDVESQLNQTWQMVAYDNLGQFKSKPFNPIMYKQPLYRLNDFVELPVSFLMTQFTGINFLMNFASDSLNVNLRIAK